MTIVHNLNVRRYTISVCLGHVIALLPYISDAGVLIPERAAFSWLINVGVIFQLLFGYIRFDQVASLKCLSADKCFSLVNKITFGIGVSVSIGLSLIGNFQLESNEKYPFSPINNQTIAGNSNNASLNDEDAQEQQVVEHESNMSKIIQNIHWTGAFFTFVGGIVWMAFQCYITNKTYQTARKSRISSTNSGSETHGLQKCSFFVRLVLTLSSVLFLVLGIALAMSASTVDENGEVHFLEHSSDTYKGCLSLAAAFCEWIVALLSVAFTLTFVAEFRHLRLKRPRVVQAEDCCISPYSRSSSSSSTPNDTLHPDSSAARLVPI